jgi:hypothetical protein
VRGLADILRTIAEVRGFPVLASMMVLAGAASFFVGSSYQAQMPGFAHDLGHGDPGTSFSSMTQTLVQMNAPEASRGRVLGLYNMAAAGLRAFSGVTVGLVGSVTSVHASLAIAAGAFIAVGGGLLGRLPR